MKYQALRPHLFSMGGWCWVVGNGMLGGVVGVGWSMAVYSDRWRAGVVLSGLTLDGD